MHDFAITEDYAVFLNCPMVFRPEVRSNAAAGILWLSWRLESLKSILDPCCHSAFACSTQMLVQALLCKAQFISFVVAMRQGQTASFILSPQMPELVWSDYVSWHVLHACQASAAAAVLRQLLRMKRPQIANSIVNSSLSTSDIIGGLVAANVAGCIKVNI